jgi:hypothetical protein
MTYVLRVAAPLLLTIALVSAGGCEFEVGGAKDDPLVAEIVDVKVEPNPVAVGDTTTFTCVIENARSDDLRFAWFLPGIGNYAYTEVNHFRWLAPEEPGTFQLKVKVRGSGRTNQAGFRVMVVSQDTSSPANDKNNHEDY